MRIIRSLINDLPIRFFVPLGFLIAAAIAFAVYLWIALPEAENRAFELTEADFYSHLEEMQGRYNAYLAQGNILALNQDIFTVADKAGVVGIALVNDEMIVRISSNSSFEGRPTNELPFQVDPSLVAKALRTGQQINARDEASGQLTGYAGLGFFKDGKMTQLCLVYVISSSEIRRNFETLVEAPVTILGWTLVFIAIAVAGLLWAKIDRRLNQLLAAARELGEGADTLALDVRGRDEFGQLAALVRESAANLAASRAAQKKAVEEARRANAAKSDFLSNMSHEIRTPMNAVIGGLSLLSSTHNAAERQEFLNASLSSARALLDIINDILDFSKLEAGHMELHPAPFHLGRLIDEVYLLMRHLAAEKRNELVLDMTDECRIWVEADPARLRQVINNLLSNAIKFTEAGQIRLIVRLVGRENPVLDIRIEDEGPGISEIDQVKLFQRFSQVTADGKQRVSGTGLGLAICKQLVTLMKGEIGVISRIGEGSAFMFSVPVKRANEQSVAALSAAGPGVKPGLNVLLAEDVKVNQMLIGKMLERMGHRVVIAADGKKAIAELDRNLGVDFDLILMDNQMPHITGIEATRLIRGRSDAKANIPIVALTAGVMKEEREAFFEAGIDGFVAKPIEMDQLKFEINRVLAKRICG